MSHEAAVHGRASLRRQLDVVSDDYDTALHVVESIRRKALTASRAKSGGAHDDDDDASDGSEGNDGDDTDEERELSDQEHDETGDDLDNNNSSCANNDAIVAGPGHAPARSRTTLFSEEQQQQSPVYHSNKAIERLRIEPLVEMHRSSSGRNLRLKHISQTSKEALSPHALTPRAPSVKRPTERPSSWSSSSSSKSSCVSKTDEAKSTFQRPFPHRSVSTGSSPFAALKAKAEAVTLYSSTSTASSSFDEERDVVMLPAAIAAGLPTRKSAFPQRQPLFGSSSNTSTVTSTRVTAKPQERRCSFRISELALREMGFSRSTTGPETASIGESNQFSDDSFFLPAGQQAQTLAHAVGRGDLFSNRVDKGEQEEEKGEKKEEEVKVVYQFDLWKKAGKSRQLPGAISTRQTEQQQQQKQQQLYAQSTNNNQQQEREQREEEQQQQQEIEKLNKGPLRRKQSIKDACEMVSILHMDHALKEEKAKSAFGRNDQKSSSNRSETLGSESPSSLCLTRSRSPTISASRSSRSFSGTALSPLVLAPESGAITKWKRGELIGEGTFGKVYMGLNSVTGGLFAVKEIEVRARPNIDDTRQLQKLGEEIELMHNLNHKHIVRYKGSHRTDKVFCIFMEYVPGGSIASMLKQFDAFSEELIKIFTRQIVEGVMYLHAMGVVHRDIKGRSHSNRVVLCSIGANVLVNEQGVSKLADFGCSKQLPQISSVSQDKGQKSTNNSSTPTHASIHTASLDESLRSIRGSVPWMAPEVVKQTGHGFKADIWSIGATVIEMATARHPWPAATNSLFAMYAIATATAPPPLPQHLSKDALAFLQRCFCIDPEERATAVELSQHPFLTF